MYGSESLLMTLLTLVFLELSFAPGKCSLENGQEKGREGQSCSVKEKDHPLMAKSLLVPYVGIIDFGRVLPEQLKAELSIVPLNEL